VSDYVLQGLIPVVEMSQLRAREGDRPRQAFRRVLIDRLRLGEEVDGSAASHVDHGNLSSVTPGALPR
jgi:hypothetical protein